MSGFVASEIRRLFSRRLFRLLGAALLVGIVAAGAITFAKSSRDPNSGLPRAKAEVARCELDRRMTAKNDPNFNAKDFACPTVSELTVQFDKRFRYAPSVTEATRGVAVVLFLLSFVVAASFVGAEWGTGSMTTLLTWEPRRGRVLAAKTIACVAVAACVAVLALALLSVVFLPAGAWRGLLDGATGAWWRTLSGVWLRAAGLAAFGAAVGAGLATLVRNTAGAVGIGFVYGAFLDPLIGHLWESRFERWVLQHNLPRMLGFLVSEPGSGVLSEPVRLSVTRPVVLFSVYAAALLLLAYATFRARDVT